MQTLKGHFTTTLEVKQSKFIAHLIPYEIYETTLEQLKIQHPKARHFVTAYRYLNEYSQIVEHSSDDGEPKGTSGKPSLMVLQGQELINVAVIIVRYFGGTKLGTGGLVRAYSDAVNLVVSEADLIEYREENTQIIEIKYGDVRLVDYEIEANNITVVEKKFDTNVVYTIKGVKESLETFLAKVARIVTLR
ncbi:MULTISPECIES: YigZ family protein [Sulfurimonas]|uniref:IMPACT family protein n=1 Tax=Sulfurimonas TaxID=202746 RepID=UPI00126580A1|nr:YigZ family protein [Sulfurimonas indica]